MKFWVSGHGSCARACLNDQVVFLVGGTRVLPLASAMQVRTVEQSDALVAQLRG